MHQQKCIINLLLHTLLFCNWVCFAGATYDALYPYSDKETWGGKMKIEDIRRRLNNIDVGNGVTPLNNTFNSIDIADGSPTKKGTVDIIVKTVGHKFCASPAKECPDWQASYINGRFARIKNPKNHVSVLPPTSGCGTLNTVSSTAKNRGRSIKNKYFSKMEISNGMAIGCKVAINAGFFLRHVKINDTTKLCNSTLGNCDCLGNLVSDGKFIQTSKATNANFGVRNGKFIIGYVNEDEVLLNGNFDQLVSGVIWLVRNGTNFVLEASNIETPETQQTSNHLMESNDRSFVDTFAARSVVGYDKFGHLLIYQIDGLHGRAYVPNGLKRGIDLISLADLLIDLGFVEAINLDGGGSSAFILNDELTSFPSDTCDKGFVCEREVTSIICVHDEISEETNQQKRHDSTCNSKAISVVNVGLVLLFGLIFAFIFVLFGNIFVNYDKEKLFNENIQIILHKLFVCPCNKFCYRYKNRYANINGYDVDDVAVKEPTKDGSHHEHKHQTVKQKNKKRNLIAIDVSKLEIEIPSLEITPKNSPRSSIDETK
eukprot:g2019.t1